MQRLQSLYRDASGIGSSDQESGSEQASVITKTVGRPVGYFRATHFRVRHDLPKQHSRVTVECVHCNDTMESRNDYMEEHILQKCKKISQKDRKDAEANVKTNIKPTAGKRPATSLSRTSLKKEQQDVGQFLHGKLTKQQQTVINRKLLKFLVMNGISFRAVNSPFFLDFVNSLNVNYIPAGREECHHRLLYCVSSGAALCSRQAAAAPGGGSMHGYVAHLSYVAELGPHC